jgi:hypothetical protein
MGSRLNVEANDSTISCTARQMSGRASTFSPDFAEAHAHRHFGSDHVTGFGGGLSGRIRVLAMIAPSQVGCSP